MSALNALALPGRVPVEAPRPRRHIEVVPTREQRRARPRIVYALASVVGVFGIFLAQLALSIVLQQGAYQLSALEAEQKDLDRTEQALIEQLYALESSQQLAASAEEMGMVIGPIPPVLSLADGSVAGTASAAGAGAGLVGAAGNLVPNSLMVDQTAVDPATQTIDGQTPQDPAVPPAPVADAPADTPVAPVQPGDLTGGGENPSGGLPTPVTH